MTEMTCSVCGTIYTEHNKHRVRAFRDGHAQQCSDECRAEHQRLRQNKNQAAYKERKCGPPKTKVPKKEKPSVLLKCDFCGKKFSETHKTKIAAAERGSKVACSEPCRRERNRQNAARFKAKIPVTIHPCANCGKPFTLTPDQTYNLIRRKPPRLPHCAVCLAEMRSQKLVKANYHKDVREKAKRGIKPISHWIPYAGVGASDFPAMLNPF